MSDTPYIEPDASIRMMTATLRQFYNGLTEAGFSNADAIYLTGIWLRQTIANTNPPGGSE